MRRKAQRSIKNDRKGREHNQHYLALIHSSSQVGKQTILSRITVKRRREKRRGAKGGRADAARRAGEGATARTTTTPVSQILAIANQDCITFPGAQDVTNIVIRGDNTHGSLGSGGGEVCYAEMTPVGAPIAFTLTRASRRRGAFRARVTRESTHAAQAGEDLIRVSAIPQSYIILSLNQHTLEGEKEHSRSSSGRGRRSRNYDGSSYQPH